MPHMIFVNLPVSDLERSRRFFTDLGYSFDERFSDESAAALVIEEGSIHSMLLTRERFASFLPEGVAVADPTQATGALLALSADSREHVDRLADRALGAGGTPWKDAMDYGSMYGRSFRDPDGHVWEVMWMSQDFIDEHHGGDGAETAGTTA